MIRYAAFAFIISALCPALRIYIDTFFFCKWKKNNFFTMIRANWNPFVPFAFRITEISLKIICSGLSCHSICLLLVRYFGRLAHYLIPCRRRLRILDIIYWNEVCSDFWTTTIDLQFVSFTKNFLYFFSILTLFNHSLTKNSIISNFQGRKWNMYGRWILSYCCQNSKFFIFVILHLSIFKHLGN